MSNLIDGDIFEYDSEKSNKDHFCQASCASGEIGTVVCQVVTGGVSVDSAIAVDISRVLISRGVLWGHDDLQP